MKLNPVPASLFISNRSRLASLMTPGSVALIKSGKRKIRSGDQFYPFRQHSDFFISPGSTWKRVFLPSCPDIPIPVRGRSCLLKDPH